MKRSDFYEDYNSSPIAITGPKSDESETELNRDKKSTWQELVDCFCDEVIRYEWAFLAVTVLLFGCLFRPIRDFVFAVPWFAIWPIAAIIILFRKIADPGDPFIVDDRPPMAVELPGTRSKPASEQQPEKQSPDQTPSGAINLDRDRKVLGWTLGVIGACILLSQGQDGNLFAYMMLLLLVITAVAYWVLNRLL